MNAFWLYLQNNGTRLLGIAIGTITVLVGTDIIPPSHVKYYLAAISVLTYWRGQYNASATMTTKAAAAIISQHAEIAAGKPPTLQPPSGRHLL